jgi:cysteine synthase B
LEEGFIPPVFDPESVDRKFLVDSRQALRALRELTGTEGIFAGISSGAVIHVGLRIAEQVEEGDIVCLLADGGWKYLSTNAWSSDLETAEKEVESTLWW